MWKEPVLRRRLWPAQLPACSKLIRRFGPLLVRNVLKETAHPVPGADRERQGAGALSPGQAVARALAEWHSRSARLQVSPRLAPEGIVFSLHDDAATSVQVLGNWDGWRSPGIAARSIESGF